MSKPCPFCGKSEAMMVSSYETHPADKDDGLPEQFQIVCDKSSANDHRGCGAASGFQDTQSLASQAWELRAA